MTIFIINSPSGGGKTTIIREILKRNPDLVFSVSYTTRKKRAHEIDNFDYNFVSENEFLKLVDNQEFFEYEKIYDNYYGSSNKYIKHAIENDFDLLLDVDVNGLKSFKNIYQDKIVSIFVIPPSYEDLEKRLKLRAKESGESLERIHERLIKFKDNMRSAFNYDYIVVNDSILRCARDIEAIMLTNQLRTSKRKYLIQDFCNERES